MAGCVLCGATSRDKFGELEHEGCCPHFMRGPDVGGDPAEWPTLLEVQGWVNEALTPQEGEQVAPIVVPEEWRDDA